MKHSAKTLKKDIPPAPTNRPSPGVRAFEKIQYELPLLIFILLLGIPHMKELPDMYYTMHIFDYRIGFAPRIFIGSLMALFTDYKSLAFMNRFFTIVFLIEAVLLAFAAGGIIRRAKGEEKETVIYFIALFFAIPHTACLPYSETLSLDRFLVIITVLALMALRLRGFRWLVPLFIVAGLATYHGFAFMYMPVIALLLIYEALKDRNPPRSLILCIIGFITMAVFSAYFFLYSGVPGFNSVEDPIAWAADKTDMSITGHAVKVVRFYLCSSPLDHLEYTIEEEFVQRRIGPDLAAAALLLPMFACFWKIWITALKSVEKKAEKFIFLMCLLAPAARIPMYFLSSDYFRFWMPVVAAQFFFLFYFTVAQDGAVLKGLGEAGRFFRKNFMLFLAMLIFFAMTFLLSAKGQWWNSLPWRMGLDY